MELANGKQNWLTVNNTLLGAVYRDVELYELITCFSNLWL